MPYCNKDCGLKHGPACLTLPSGNSVKIDSSCLKVKYGRTDVGDFAYCEEDKVKFYRGSIYGELGWYAGRGY